MQNGRLRGSMLMKISFGSDNHAGIHPAVFEALTRANNDYQPAYGDDSFSLQAQALFKEVFGPRAHSFFVFNGTGANVLCLKALTQPYNAIVCAQTAHINVDECGAPENATGCKLLTCPVSDGKLRPEDVKKQLHGFGFQHHAQPKVISISQATEMGTLYTPQEIKALADLAHSYGMYLHVDGSRLANAAASLNCSMADLTSACGIDALSLGGTKNGMLLAEAVVLFDAQLAENFLYIRKQAMQLFSKSRFIAAQYLTYFENELWRSNARHANEMALYLAQQLEKMASQLPNPDVIRITQPVESNAVFAIIPKDVCQKLMDDYCFYVWDEDTGEVRWMCAFNTQKVHIDQFVKDLNNNLL